MRRYYYEGSLQEGSDLSIQGDLFHHIFDVCRLQKGQHFELLNEEGKAFLTEVMNVEKKRALVHLKEERLIPELREPHIYLYMSFPKVPTFESVVEKAVELGVKAIVPFLSEFSHIRTQSQYPSAKHPRWQKIILQATQQSGRGDLMKIDPVRNLHEVLREVCAQPESLTVVAYEGDTALVLKEFLQQKKQKTYRRINIFVGSEGGFSDAEVMAFKDLDLPPVSLGPQVLRVETACMTLVASLKYEFELLR